MLRTSVALGAAIILCGPLPGAPVPKAAQPKPFYPTVPGTKWVFTNLDGKELTEEVTAAERKGAATLVTIRAVVGNGPPNEYQLRVDTAGLFRLHGEAFGRPLETQYLKFPHKAGSEWKTYTGAWPLGTSRLVARAVEEIEVPAGTFQALRVDTVFASKMGPDRAVSWWFTPGVGLVKHTIGESTQVLKSFTPGKE
jgi:hypothetical protein